MRTLAKVLVGLALSAFVPATVYAQASIAGQVRDPQGALMPGVTVEAASPALIEKVRTVVTDSTGQYRVADLRPGTYMVTFTLPGFATVQREGIELAGSFTATINIELKVGAIAETVTVTGETPIVDVQSATRQTVLNNETLNTIPSVRSLEGVMRLVPGVIGGTSAVGPAFFGPCCTLNVHGGRAWEGRMQIDGIDSVSTRSGMSGYVPDTGTAQEVVMTISGASVESEQGGPTINVVPRTGGNTVHGQLFGQGTWKALQGDNFTDALRASVRTPADNIRQWDINGSIGGPIRKDRLWYYGTIRDTLFEQSIPGMYANANAGNSNQLDPNAFRYVADLNTPARTIVGRRSYALRMTWQATARNKFGVFWDEQPGCSQSGWTKDSSNAQEGKACRDPKDGFVYGGAATTSAEAGQYDGSPQRVFQTSWSSPVSNKLLLQAGFGAYQTSWGGRERPGNPTRGIPVMTQQGGAIPNLLYGSNSWGENWMGAYKWQASGTYITGAHSLKVGYQDAFFKDDLSGWPGTNNTNDLRLAYTFASPTSAAPNTHSITEGVWFEQKLRLRTPTVYVQDQWKRDRLTLSGGVRYDRNFSWYPAQGTRPGERFLPTPITFPEKDGIKGYNDITPRVSAAYDLFGNGKTSLKVNLGKYLEAAATTGTVTSGTNDLARIATATSRQWNDANGNRILECPNLATTLGPTGECGAILGLGFGSNTATSTLDPTLVQGWGLRGNDWGFGASVQHEVLPRVSVEVGYNRRWFGNFLATDNRNLASSQFTQFSIPVPVDSRLPNGGGGTLGGLYNQNINPISDNFIQLASNIGNRTEYWQGVDVNVNARLRGGLTLQGGTSTGQTTADSCEVRGALPESAPVNPFCHTAPGYVTQYKALGAYTIPRIDVQVSSTFTSAPGATLAANYTVTNNIAFPSLGRNLVNAPLGVIVNLITPGDLYGDRVNQVDFRVGKVLRFGSTRMTISADLYNMMNASAVTAYNQTYDPATTTWLTPTAVMPARYAKFGAQLDF